MADERSEMNTIDELIIDGFSLKYFVEGQGMPAIVIGSHLYYPRTFSQDLGKNLQLIHLDQRAFSSKPNATEEDFHISKILNDIEQLRMHLKLGKVIIIGHSIHAFMAMEYARNYPESVSHLVLIAASPTVGNEVFKAADTYFAESVCPDRKAALSKNLQSTDQSHKQDRFIQRMLTFAPMIWYDYDFNAKDLWQDVKLDLIGAGYVWGKMFDGYQINDPITVPVFLGLGRYDHWNPPYLWEQERNKFSNLTIRIFEQSSHTPQFEEPELFNAQLIDWLNK